MALGGGTFTTMNKIMPGAYINYVSAERADAALSDRGIAALPLELKWGKDGEVFEVEADNFESEAVYDFGYLFDSEELKSVREVFKHAEKCLFYKLNSGTKAVCSISEARYKGSRGNDIRHVVTANVDDTDKIDVVTYIGEYKADVQTVGQMAELVDNDFVIFNRDAALEITAGMNLTGGTDGEVTGLQHHEALDALEAHSFNALGCMSAEKSVKALYSSFCRRMRDSVGVKFQLVVKDLDADYIGTINLQNNVSDKGEKPYALVPWVVGAEAGCAVNRSCDNLTYDGEYTVNTDYRQSELQKMIRSGMFVFHKVGNKANVLSDINSYVNTTYEINEDFQLNQVIRVLDQIATDEAAIFNTKFLGKVQNDEDGRIAFWSDCVSIHKQLLKLRAIEEFEETDIVVERGRDKRTVITYDAVKPVCAMNKLYMTICAR